MLLPGSLALPGSLPLFGDSTTSFTQLTPFSEWQHLLLEYAVAGAMFALLAGCVYSAMTAGELSKRWRPAAVASTLVCLVAFLSYVVITAEVVLGYREQGGAWVPRPGTVVTELRYIDWTVTVPLLVVEFLAVCSVSASRVVWLRFSAVAAAFLMILTGFFGVVDVGAGTPGPVELLVWGAVSTVFFLYLYAVLLGAVRRTRPTVGTATSTSLRNAAVLLLSVFGVYPLVYLVPLWAGPGDGGWALTVQVLFSAADVAAKVGFGVLVHKVAKLRTAEDARTVAGSTPDVYPGEVYVSGHLVAFPTAAPIAPAAPGSASGAPVAPATLAFDRPAG